MNLPTSAPWHRASFERFLNESLPKLLASRVPLVEYDAASTGPSTCRVRIGVRSPDGTVDVVCNDVPQPDEEGVFELDGLPRVVVPTASVSELDVAEVRCVGEQLLDEIESRLGEAPRDLPWDESLVRAWLPLDRWVRQFLAESTTAQPLDDRNWLARHTHLRRIHVLDRTKVIAPGQFGRTCPFEVPEGVNIGRVLTIALGAEIRDGRIVIVDDRPEAALGITASMVPLLEHDDANRLLMGCNMMRQWRVSSEVEPALVQTGSEIDAPGFWCGKNFLTAFVSWGADTYEDAIILSQSAAKRLATPECVEVGDKLSNRHGTKGVVSRILPDDEMPHLADGTPVELIFSFMGMHTRLNFGQVREAVLGRIARAKGEPVIVPPFQSPDSDALRRMLNEAGLPPSGMETLHMGRKGESLKRPSTVGWVYWGCTYHVAREKIHATNGKTWVARPEANLQAEDEYIACREVGAYQNILERYNTCSQDRPDAQTLADRLAAGPVEQADPPSPAFAELTRRLDVLGIHADFTGEKVAFELDAPRGKTMKLAAPVAHPWLHGREIAAVGVFEGVPEYAALVDANSRAVRILAGGAPDCLRREALKLLEAEVHRFADVLVSPDHLRFSSRVLFSDRSVICPDDKLRIDQLGVAEEIAWTLFGPLLRRELGDVDDVAKRSARARKALDRIMTRSWVILNRAPTFMPTALLAFHPVRIPDKVIRIHPLINRLMNADFDGDQAAMFLPVTDAAQAEAGEKLSVLGHLKRDPELLHWLVPIHEMLWGLVELGLTPDGRAEIARRSGFEPAMPDGFLTRDSLERALATVRERDGLEKLFELLEWVMHRGFDVAKSSGASLSPFIAEGLEPLPRPDSDDPEAWAAFAEEVCEALSAFTDFDDDLMGPQALSVKTGARGSVQSLAVLVGPRGRIRDASDSPVPCRHGMAEGLTAEELFTCTVGARRGLAEVALRTTRESYGLPPQKPPTGFGVLARARRANRPGMIFARAAARGETDPLTDLDARLFVGLPGARAE